MAKLPQILNRGVPANSTVNDSRDVLKLFQKSNDLSQTNEQRNTVIESLDDLTDEHGNSLTRAQARRAERFDDLDRQTEIIKQLIQADKNYKYLVILEKQEQRRRGGLGQIIKQKIADFLVPPAIRPEYEREQAEIKMEQMALKKKKQNIFKLDSKSKNEAEAGKGVKSQVLAAPGFVHRQNNFAPPLLQRSEKDNVQNERRFEMLANYCGDRFQSTRQGLGVQIFENGSRYEGQWLNGYQEGFGQIKFQSGEEYCGQWHLGHQHGLGVYKAQKGTYSGFWSKGVRNGYGQLSDHSSTFRGEWCAGKKHGCGVQTKFGVTYMGEWLDGKKHGNGIVRSDVAQFGVGQFMTSWNQGKLVGREPYDALHHGMDILNAARWASHYAGAAAEDAITVIRKRISFPDLPIQRQITKSDLQLEDKPNSSNGEWQSPESKAIQTGDSIPQPLKLEALQLPEHVQRFRATWVTSRSAIETCYPDLPSRPAICPRDKDSELSFQQDERIGRAVDAQLSDVDKAVRPPADTVTQLALLPSFMRTSMGSAALGENRNKTCERFCVAVRELQRLISLVHSAEKIVEDLVVPILNDAIQVKIDGDDFFSVGPIWMENLTKLKTYFAIKIQKKWRSMTWKRAFKAARGMIADAKELELLKIAAKQSDLEKEYESELQLSESRLIDKINRDSLRFKFAALVEQGECNTSIVEFVKKSKKIFDLEMREDGCDETTDRWVLFDDEIVGKVKIFPSTGTSEQKDLATVASMKDINIDTITNQTVFDKDDVDVTCGKLITGNGIVYYGQIGNKVPHGFGTARYPDGSLYAGQFVFRLRHGLGEYIRQVEDNDRHLECLYLGEWHNNLRHGFAIEQKKVVGFINELLSSVLVEYKNDEAVSSASAEQDGCESWLAQCREVSNWARRAAEEAQSLSHDKKVSKQSALKMSKLYEFAVNEGCTSYLGSFDEFGRKHGPGMMEQDNGHRLAGDWNQNVFEGFGREDFPDGSSYVGQFLKGKRDGRGRYECFQGDSVTTFHGEWKLGQRNGRGVEKKEIIRGDVKELEWIATVDYLDDLLVNFESYNQAKVGSLLNDVDVAVRNGSRCSSMILKR